MTDAILPRCAVACRLYLMRLFSFEATLGNTFFAGVPFRIWLTPW